MSDYTEADLSALKKALVSGTSRVTYGGNTVEFRSVQDIETAIATVKRSLNGKKRIRRTLLTSGGGH